MPVMTLIAPHVMQNMIDEAKLTPDGCFVEVGVYKGGSAWHLSNLAKLQNRDLYLFDTFTGIPYKGEWDSHNVADFNDTSLDAVREAIPDAVIVPGIFPVSAENIELRHIAFAHIDCDQYQSVKESAAFLAPRMLPGGVMWFDDYYCLDGATRAVNELFPGRIEISQHGAKAIIRF